MVTAYFWGYIVNGQPFPLKERANVEIVQMNPAALIPYENNTKTHPPEQVDRIAESIKRFGWQQPIVVDRDNVVIIGHGRLMAAKQLMLDTVPVVYADNLTEEEAQALRLADNKTNESPWDFGKLEEELAALSIAGIDMTAFGFDDLEAQIDAPEVQEVETPEAPEEPKAKRGEIYRLGEHRLMCGDSTDMEAVRKLFDGGQPFCIVTDPPYCSGGFQEAGKKSGSIGTRDKIMIANDTLSTRGYMALIKNVIHAAGEVGVVYSFTDWRMWINLFDCMEQSGFGVRNMIIWDKGTPGMGVGWRSQHEICMMASRSAQKFNPHKAQGNVIKCARTGNVNHPTEKPVELIAKIIDVTDFAEEIYDPFAGSGTTLIACEQLQRKCYAMELDPAYVDVIINRWEDMTGQKAELIQGAD